MEDSRIIELFFQRNEQAIRETAAKYGPYCMQISRNILNDPHDCEENVNDTYLQTWNSIPPQRPDTLKAYLAKITRNLALNRFQADHAQKRGSGEFCLSLEELGDCTPSAVSVENGVQMAELSKSISRFLRSEPPEARKVFVCRYFYSESIADISRRFSCSSSKVKSMLLRSRNRLKKHLTEEGFFEK